MGPVHITRAVKDCLCKQEISNCVKITANPLQQTSAWPMTMCPFWTWEEGVSLPHQFSPIVVVAQLLDLDVLQVSPATSLDLGRLQRQEQRLHTLSIVRLSSCQWTREWSSSNMQTQWAPRAMQQLGRSSSRALEQAGPLFS